MSSIHYNEKELEQIALDFDEAILKLERKKYDLLKGYMKKMEKIKLYRILHDIDSIKDD